MSPPNPYFEALIPELPNVTGFGDKVFKEVIKVN